jgi:hypothetical protein
MSFFLNRCPSPCCLPLASPAVEPARRARERMQFPAKAESVTVTEWAEGPTPARFSISLPSAPGGGTVSGKQWCDGERLKRRMEATQPPARIRDWASGRADRTDKRGFCQFRQGLSCDRRGACPSGSLGSLRRRERNGLSRRSFSEGGSV